MIHSGDSTVCPDCAYYECTACISSLCRDACEHLKMLKEENERLNKKYENLDKYTDKFANQICELEQENKKLLKQIKQGTGERKC